MVFAVVSERGDDGGEGKKTENDRGRNSVFKGVVPLRKHPPLSRTDSTPQQNDLVLPLARAAVTHGLGPVLLRW